MLQLSFTNYPFRLRHINQKPFVYDPIRKKWLMLTPEEWVRQNLIAYLVDQAQMPAACISVEKAIKINQLTKRYDIVVYKADKPWLLVECKAPNIELDENVWLQIAHYNQNVEAGYCMISNGHQHWLWDINHQKFLDKLPPY